MVEFTDIRVFRMKNSDRKIRAFVNVTIDGEFVVHGIKIMESEKGLWVAMPSQRSALGEYNDIFHPITREARDRLIEAVLSSYRVGEKRQAVESNSSPEVSQQNSAL